jgi:CrcB protein
MVNYMVVFVGGGIGSVFRYILAVWIGQKWGRSFPLGTFAINVTGSFLIGFLMTLMAERFVENPQWRLLLVVGGLGGYTTFSTFQYETGKLVMDGELGYGERRALPGHHDRDDPSRVADDRGSELATAVPHLGRPDEFVVSHLGSVPDRCLFCCGITP